MRERILAAVALVVVAIGLTYTVPTLAELTTEQWGDFTATGFMLALLVAWPTGNLIFTQRRRKA